MQVEVPDRMLAPLVVLDAAGPLRSRLQLRLLTLLAQRKCGGGAYRPEAGGYWPRFDALDLDVSCSPHLIGHSVTTPSKENSRFCHVYRITRRGARCLGDLESRAPPGAADGMRGAVEGLLRDMPATLLEVAQSELGPEEGTGRLEGRVAADLARTMPPILDACVNRTSVHAIALAEILETTKEMLSLPFPSGSGDARRRVILLLSGEIAMECSRLGGRMARRGSTREDPRVADADDLAANLARYCEARGLSGADPMTLPLSGVLSEEKARRLCEDLLNT